MERGANNSNDTTHSLAYLTPGVYRRPQPAHRDDIAVVRTDVAGFVGFAERGPLPANGEISLGLKKLAVRLTSWKEYRAVFGGFTAFGCLAYAVRAFFENGGTTCYVVRVAATNVDPGERPRVASLALPAALRVFPKTSDQPSLKAKAVAGQRVVIIQNAEAIADGDLIEIGSSGTTEFCTVVDRREETVTLARNLAADHPPSETWLGVYDPALVVTALSSGNWGNRIRLEMSPLESGSQVTAFALRVTLEPGIDRSAPVEEEFYSHLSLTPKDPFYAPRRVNGVSNLIELQVQINDAKKPRPLLVAGGPLARGAVRLQGGQDGLSKVDVLDFTGGLADMRGLRLLEDLNEVSMLCVPDAVFEPPIVLESPAPPAHAPCAKPPKPPEPDPLAEDPTARRPALDEQKVTYIYGTMIEQCERLRDRVAILEAPAERRTPQQLSGWALQFPTRFAALYYPWLKIPDPAEIEGATRRVPPGGHVAGIYARIDNQFGVQRPPANAALEFVTDVVDEVDSVQQENLNPYGVNVIRSFAGRGIRVWGARSLAGAGDADWRYIHTRRLMSMIEESVDHSMQWAVFEPNNEALRRTLVHSLSVFLETIWRKGGLKGAVPSEGFYVRCDETNNPGSVVDLGKIVCQVGVAVAAPMEFLVFEIRHMPGGAQILEF
jgi:hypothetical protein